MGEKIYKKLSLRIEPSLLETRTKLHDYLVRTEACKGLNPKELEALEIYLFDRSLREANSKDNAAITPQKSDKCPVCGMFVYKYPRWAALIEYEKSKLYFDGVKDLMKFYFNPQAWGEYDPSEKIRNIAVRDYYTQKSVDAKEAYFVLGSDVYGPMGNELIPFAAQEDAKHFYMDHKAKAIYRFNELTSEIVYGLDD